MLASSLPLIDLASFARLVSHPMLHIPLIKVSRHFPIQVHVIGLTSSQSWFQSWLVYKKSFCQCQSDRFSLARDSTSFNKGENVVLVHSRRDLKGPQSTLAV